MGLLFNDPDPDAGFLLSIDTKWKSHPDPNLATPEANPGGEVRAGWRGHASVRDLYVLAICHRRDIHSLRDLRATHLPLLRNILVRGRAVIQETYGIQAKQLRVFVHYQPQFYHFHVHFTRVDNNNGCQAERAHLLQEVIANLEADGDTYEKKTLLYRMRKNEKLMKKIREATQHS